MRSLLAISYSLKLRDLYQAKKEEVPGFPGRGKFPAYRRKMLQWVLPLVRKAFREGRAFAIAYAESRGVPVDSEIGNRITDKEKNRILGVFIQRIKFAEKVYQLKYEQNIRLRALNKVKRNNSKGGYLIIEKEFHSAVKQAVNHLILNAGTVGQEEVWK